MLLRGPLNKLIYGHVAETSWTPPNDARGRETRSLTELFTFSHFGVVFSSVNLKNFSKFANQNYFFEIWRDILALHTLYMCEREYCGLILVKAVFNKKTNILSSIKY